jgi:hypothetical protein
MGGKGKDFFTPGKIFGAMEMIIAATSILNSLTQQTGAVGWNALFWRRLRQSC